MASSTLFPGVREARLEELKLYVQYPESDDLKADIPHYWSDHAVLEEVRLLVGQVATGLSRTADLETVRWTSRVERFQKITLAA